MIGLLAFFYSNVSRIIKIEETILDYLGSIQLEMECPRDME